MSAPDMPTQVSGTSIRAAFVDRFGEEDALNIEAAAHKHSNGVNSQNKGSDPFKWALLIAIGYECMSKDSYREYHGVKAPWPDLKQWIVDNADLGSHDGDCDYLAAFTGAYEDFIPAAQVQA